MFTTHLIQFFFRSISSAVVVVTVEPWTGVPNAGLENWSLISSDTESWSTLNKATNVWVTVTNPS